MTDKLDKEAKHTLSQVANKQAELLKKLKDLPATREAQAILDLLTIQVEIAHIIAKHISRKR